MSPPGHMRLYVGNAAAAVIDPAHRGIAYGDGLFETMRVHGGAIPWWERHWARLQDGATRLGLRLPDPSFAAREAAAMAQAAGDGLLKDSPLKDGVLKLICSRGPGGRGYAPGPQADSHWQLAWHPLPPAVSRDGLVLRWCATRLARQPLLAGLKHCNRLEQVLARAEWADTTASDRDADEGLLCDVDGEVISATAANVFVLRAGRWETPALAQCGVAGVCRGVLLDVLDAREAVLTPRDVDTADAVFLCNAVRGILPVARLAQRRWTLHPATAQARRWLGEVHPAFVPEIS